MTHATGLELFAPILHKTRMKLEQTATCPNCGNDDLTHFQTYITVHKGSRELHQCSQCGNIFSETWGTPMQDLKSPTSKVASVLRVRSEGLRKE